VLYLWVNNIRN